MSTLLSNIIFIEVFTPSSFSVVGAFFLLTMLLNSQASKIYLYFSSCFMLLLNIFIGTVVLVSLLALLKSQPGFATYLHFYKYNFSIGLIITLLVGIIFIYKQPLLSGNYRIKSMHGISRYLKVNLTIALPPIIRQTYSALVTFNKSKIIIFNLTPPLDNHIASKHFLLLSEQDDTMCVSRTD